MEGIFKKKIYLVNKKKIIILYIKKHFNIII